MEKITDINGNTFVLQIEFQVLDEPKMAHRMAEYFIMLDRKYDLPIEQFVIFLGSSTPKMPNKLIRKRMNFEFPLIILNQIDYQMFLKSDKPEEIILGVLGDFKQENPEIVIKKLIQRIQETSDGDFSLNRYFNQLRVLAQLRKLELKLKNIMDSIAKYVSEERDVLYLRGLDKGMEKGMENASIKFVLYLLTEANRTFDQIADIAGVSVDFVKTVKQKFSEKKE